MKFWLLSRGTLEQRACLSWGRGWGARITLSHSWGSFPAVEGWTHHCQLVYAKVLLVFLCFYFLS